MRPSLLQKAPAEDKYKRSFIPQRFGRAFFSPTHYTAVMRPFLRYLRIAFSTTCLIALLLLIALWVRSYRYIEVIHLWRTTSAQEQIVPPEWAFLDVSGMMGIDYFPDSSPFATREWEFERYRVDEAGPCRPEPSYLGFHVELSQYQRKFFAPHWFLILIAGALAAVPWIRQLKWRFSLRTLLIAMAFVAAVFGAIMYALI